MLVEIYIKIYIVVTLDGCGAQCLFNYKFFSSTQLCNTGAHLYNHRYFAHSILFFLLFKNQKLIHIPTTPSWASHPIGVVWASYPWLATKIVARHESGVHPVYLINLRSMPS